MTHPPLPSIAPLVLALIMGCGNPRPAALDAPPPEPPPTTGIETAPVQEPTGPRFGGPEAADSLFFSLERTPCYGPCPAFVINVYRSGFATYRGRANVERMGEHTGRVPPDLMEELLTKAEGYGLFTMRDKYDAEVTDLPSTIIHVRSTGRSKKVLGRVAAPEAFRKLAAVAQGLLDPLTWTPVPPKP